MIKGYLVGDFDLFNVGDLDVIRQAAERCDALTVGVLTDEEFESVHGRSPVVPFDERREIVRNIRGVAEVSTFAGWPGDSAYDVVFEDVRMSETRSPVGAFAGAVATLDVPEGTGSEVLRRHLNGRGAIAEAS